MASLRPLLSRTAAWHAIPRLQAVMSTRSSAQMLRQRLTVLAAALSGEKPRSWQHASARFLAGATGLLAAGALCTATAVCASKNDPVLDDSLLAAVVNSTKENVERLIKTGANVNARHRLGWCPLHAAAMNGRADICRLLLSNGADVNMADRYDASHGAAFRQRMVEFSRGIRPDFPTVGFTALHYAVLADNSEVVQLLMEHQADPQKKTDNGILPEQLSDSPAMIEKLRAYSESYGKMAEEKARRERRMFPLEERVKKYIVGQEGPVRAVAAAIRRKENAWHDEDKPLVFLFLGSSGLGKTELAKRIGQYVHGKDKESFIRIDMSEYQEKHEVAKFIGSPPGYIGHDEGGQLTKQLASCPNAVVLFDEVEKAHPDILTILLQLFDEGRMTDGKGQTVDCKDAIFIMTSNLAQDEIAEYALEARKENPDAPLEFDKDFKDNCVRPILKRHFQRNEFLGRINEVLYFVPFSRSELKQLVELHLSQWAEKAKKRHSIDLTWDSSVVELICADYDVHYGARSLHHSVDKRIINKLAEAHEQEKLKPGSKVRLVASNGEPSMVIEEGPPPATSMWSRLTGR